MHHLRKLGKGLLLIGGTFAVGLLIILAIRFALGYFIILIIIAVAYVLGQAIEGD